MFECKSTPIARLILFHLSGRRSRFMIGNHHTPIRGILPHGACSAIGLTNLVFSVFALVQGQPIAYLLHGYPSFIRKIIMERLPILCYFYYSILFQGLYFIDNSG